MKGRIVGTLLLGITALSAIPVIADIDPMRYTGQGNKRTETFSTEGAWLLDWRTTSDFPLLAKFEVRLHDGSGAFLGNIIQLQGTGSGLRLFEEGGEFQLVIAANNVDWELEIAEIEAEQAARLKRRSEDRPSLQDVSQRSLSVVRESSFSTWRAVQNDTLLLFDGAGTGFRVSFRNACPGLESATAISFVTPSGGPTDVYNSILLDDGTRCHFDEVVPTIME